MNGNSYTSNYIGSNEAAARPVDLQAVPSGPVDGAISVIANEQGKTFELLDLLEEKLSKTLCPEPDSKPHINDRTQSATALLQMIDARQETAAAINARLGWIMDRIVL